MVQGLVAGSVEDFRPDHSQDGLSQLHARSGVQQIFEPRWRLPLIAGLKSRLETNLLRRSERLFW